LRVGFTEAASAMYSRWREIAALSTIPILGEALTLAERPSAALPPPA
jgi:hypothetical protein